MSFSEFFGTLIDGASSSRRTAMKKTRVVIQLILCGLLIAVLQSNMACITSAGSGTQSSVEIPAEKQPGSDQQQKISQIDQEIQKVRNDIEDTTDIINQTFLDYTETHNQLEKSFHFHHDSNLSMSGGQSGLESNDQRLIRISQDLQAQNEYRDRLQEKLENLKNQRDTILDQSSGCFPAQTKVLMHDGSRKVFLDIRPGDMVMTYDIGYRSLVAKPVLEVFSFDADHLYRINKHVLTTGGERFLTQQGWKASNSLEVGDFILVDQEMTPVTSIEYLSENLKVYNMHVADTFNYYVATDSAGNYLVHNSGGGGGGGGGAK